MADRLTPATLGTVLVLGLGLAAARPTFAQESPALAEARRLLDAGDDPAKLSRAIALLETARGRGESADLLAALAEAYYQQGVDEVDRSRAIENLDVAIGHGARALTLVPGHLRARYWRTMATLAKAGKLRSIESVRMVRQAAKELEGVAAADPDLDDAGADRAMGKVYLDSPWWFMGDTEKAVEHLEKARQRAPHSFKNRLFLAEAYAEDGREEDALRELEAIMAMPTRPDHAASDQKRHDEARRMAEQIRARRPKP